MATTTPTSGILSAEKSEADSQQVITDEMRAAAAAFGRIGGKIGGGRAEKLSAKRSYSVL